MTPPTPNPTSNPGGQPVSGLLPAEPTGVDMLAKFFRALGEPARLRLLEYLLAGERTVSACVQHVGLAQGRVSTHLACLADCGYVATRRAGRHTYYRVTDPRVAELVHLARAISADNAAALAACLRIDTPASDHADQEGTR